MADEEDDVQRPLIRRLSECYRMRRSRGFRARAGSEAESVHQEGNYRISTADISYDSGIIQQKRWDLNYREAAIFLQEGENNDKFTSHPRSREDLPTYMITHNLWYHLLMLAASLMILFLAVFEQPAVDKLTLPISVHGSIEIVCLLVLTVELILKFRWLGPQKFVRHIRTMTTAIILVVMFVEAIVVIIRQTNHIRVTRALRPIFLLDSPFCRGVRRFIRQIILTLPSILNMLVLLLFFLLLFTTLGFYLFNDVPHDTYFQGFIESFISLFILLTTANFPDVMMPAYKDNRWSAVFFIIFISLELFIFMNIFLAVVYSTFLKIEKKKVRDLLLHRRAACAEAFRLLVGERTPDLVSARHFAGCMKYFRPRMSRLKVYLVFKLLNKSKSGKLSLDEFRSVYEGVPLNWKKKPSDQLWSVNFKPPFNRICAALNTLVQKKLFDYFIYGVIFANFIWILLDTIRISYAKSSSSDPSNYKWYIDELHYLWISGLFVAIYIIEAILKILGLGPARYFASGWNIFDFIVTIVSLIGLLLQLVNDGFYYIVLIRPLRVLRLFKVKRLYRDVFGTLFILFKRMLSLAVVMLIVYYFFAIIGMEAFSSYTSKLMNCCRNTSVETYYTYNNETGLDGYYYLNTFENIFISGVTLFELTVVNNWWIIMEGFTTVSSHWARIYFMIFYIIVIVVMTVVVAFVFEAFTFRIQYRQQMISDRNLEDQSIKRVDVYLSNSELVMCENVDISLLGDFIPQQKDQEATVQTPNVSNSLQEFTCYRGEKILNKDELSLKIYGSEVKEWIEQEDLSTQGHQIRVQLSTASQESENSSHVALVV